MALSLLPLQYHLSLFQPQRWIQATLNCLLLPHPRPQQQCGTLSTLALPSASLPPPEHLL